MTRSGTEKAVAALNDPYHLFTRDQVAFLMARATRWGREGAGYDLAHAYELGRASAHRELAELNMAAIESAITVPPFSAGEIEKDRARQAARAAADQAAREPRDSDHPGGPVPEWDLGPDVAQRATEAFARLDALPRVMMHPTREWP
jgi:hypothetical protein